MILSAFYFNDEEEEKYINIKKDVQEEKGETKEKKD